MNGMWYFVSLFKKRAL